MLFIEYYVSDLQNADLSSENRMIVRYYSKKIKLLIGETQGRDKSEKICV